ncbi:hypothetical protein AOC36_06895 [Erysipelothrix larvae]|uniref:Uncharacterized protein n=1 Tax=Erysipelothrix larvae TaxID=1514105 RepID=A0A109UH84_9FIRM|nr:hypothetical protein [Erysipelothrix larvae]AMC93718.1 hypothetical protein AOC36_06895 [Erysipelothrix larvae]
MVGKQYILSLKNECVSENIEFINHREDRVSSRFAPGPYQLQFDHDFVINIPESMYYDKSKSDDGSITLASTIDDTDKSADIIHFLSPIEYEAKDRDQIEDELYDRLELESKRGTDEVIKVRQLYGEIKVSFVILDDHSVPFAFHVSNKLYQGTIVLNSIKYKDILEVMERWISSASIVKEENNAINSFTAIIKSMKRDNDFCNLDDHLKIPLLNGFDSYNNIALEDNQSSKTTYPFVMIQSDFTGTLSSITQLSKLVCVVFNPEYVSDYIRRTPSYKPLPYKNEKLIRDFIISLRQSYYALDVIVVENNELKFHIMSDLKRKRGINIVIESNDFAYVVFVNLEGVVERNEMISFIKEWLMRIEVVKTHYS